MIMMIMMTMKLFSANNDGDHDEYIIQLMASTFDYARKKTKQHMLPTYFENQQNTHTGTHTHTNAPKKNLPSKKQKNTKPTQIPEVPSHMLQGW